MFDHRKEGLLLPGIVGLSVVCVVVSIAVAVFVLVNLASQ